MKGKKAKILSLALTIVLLFTFVGTALACFDPPPTYSLTIVKSFSGISELPESMCVTVTNLENSKLIESFNRNAFTLNTDGTLSYTLSSKLAPGNYKVKETNAEVDGYNLTATGNDQTITIYDRDVSAYITNTYQIKTGSLTIIKTFSGDTVAPPDGLRFKVLQGTTVMADISYAIFEGTPPSYTVDNLAVGEYQIIEENADIDGYDLTVNGLDGLVEVTSEGATVTIDNEYKQKETPEGTLYVEKYAVTDDSELDFNGRTFSFEVLDDEDNKVNGAEFFITVNDSGYGSSSLTLPAGKYTLVETGREIDGYDVETMFKEFAPCAALAAGAENNDGDPNENTGKDADRYEFTIEAGDYAYTRIMVTNSYTKQTPTLSVTKEVTNYDSGNTEFTFLCVIYDGEGEEWYRDEFTLTDGQKWTIGELTPGFTYYIEEINIPQNYYAVSEPVSGTIEAGDNEVTYYNAYESPDIPNTPVYYSLVVNWIDEDTGTILASSETISYLAGVSYDVSSKQKTFDGFSFSRTDGADLTGVMNGNKTVTFYYKAAGEIEEIEEEDVPLIEQPEEVQTPEEPQVIPGEDPTAIDIATDEIPLADVPQTGDDNNITLLALLLGTGLAGIAALTILPQKSRKRK